jgi:PAS domain S-box-containing protein
VADKEKRANLLGLEDPFAQLVREALDYAIFLLDRDGRIVSWNRGAERLKGYTAAEVIGRHFSMFYPREAIERRWPEQELENAAARGRFEDEGWRLRKDDSRFWANVVISALRDKHGELRGFCKITRDVSERRQHEELLRQSEERFRLLAEGVKDHAIYMLDRDGRVASWNAGAERLEGYKAQEIIGRHFSAFYPKEAIAKKWPEQQLALAREQGRFEEEGLCVRKNGTTFWANVLLTPVYDEQGVLQGYANVTHDLTDRKRVEALEKAERQTNEFLAMLAHELRNPLAPISNALHLLARKPAVDPTEQWVREVLQRQTEQLTRLVDDLLEVSRITRSTVSLNRQPLDVRNVVRAALQDSLQWTEPEEELTVLADEARLAQVFHTLLHNALEVSARREGDEVRIDVKNGGMEGGLGVGLPLVQRLVHLHGGTLKTQGSEFVLRLPAAGAPAGEGRMEERTLAPVPPQRVLVVDDNQDAANALRLLLESDGHDVKVANDGASALALAREYRPDYLLLDIALPRLSGYDIASSLRSDPALKDTTIVAVTGYGQVHDRARTAAQGFDYHLTKPVEFTALQALFRAKA